MSHWLAIDYGTKRIGVAGGDTIDGIAGPISVVPAKPREAAIASIRKLAEEYGAEGIVVGWPLNMDDSRGPQADAALRLAIDLARSCRLDIRMWDERLSSFQADQALAGKWTRKKRRARQDAVAAAEILRDFLANDGPGLAHRPDELCDQER